MRHPSVLLSDGLFLPAKKANLFILQFVLLCFLAGCATQASAPVSRNRQGIFHVVKPGETLFRIGKTYGIPYRELARINRLKDPNFIRVGQRIFIPRATRQMAVEVTSPGEPVAEPASMPQSAESADGLFIWPVSGTINSGFGPRGASFHDGIDIAAPEGTPIRSIADGEVLYSDRLRGYGNIVIVRHASGFASVYAHNQVNLVHEGQIVSQGEVIALVGRTGRVTGPHLHFEIRKDNRPQDPLGYLPQLCCLEVSDTVSPDG